MQEIVFPFAGGLGLFLIGMMLLSQGLVAMGGATMKQALAHFTGTPAKAFVSGTLATMAVQSSTATTVTLIGFVSAGLITFHQTIGVLIGASLGNTATGWIVAALGLKIKLGFYTLPLIGLGAMLKLLTKGRWAHLGLACAGFGLMFLGLDTLQQGMRGLAGLFNLAKLPTGGYLAHGVTMLIGLALTAVLQSSTAAIATTLTALHTQTINFDQAAALVVGAAIGTTLTGALVAIGGTIHAKRTALAYILFNLVSGCIALALLPLYLSVIAWLGTHAGLAQDATSLAAFHTLFILVGVVLFLPFVPQFARLVERLLPERETVATQRLDATLLTIPAVALEATQRALEDTSLELLDVYDHMLSGSLTDADITQLEKLAPQLNEIYGFVGRIELPAADVAAHEPRIAQLHAIDHLLRLRIRLHHLAETRTNLTEPSYQWAQENSQQILQLARHGLQQRELQTCLESLERNAAALAELSRQVRNQVLKATMSSPEQSAQALKQSDHFRWLERTGSHIWQICCYLSQGRPAEDASPRAPVAAPAPDRI